MEELHAKGLRHNQLTAIKTPVRVRSGCQNLGFQSFIWLAQGTNNILISVVCQPPAGYNLVASVDTYYKAVKNSVTWQVARDACSSEGTILVELRTAAEYQAIRPYFGKVEFRYCFLRLKSIILFLDHVLNGEFWTGLWNPNNDVCYDAGCANKLKWDSDGSFLGNWPYTSHTIRTNNAAQCLRYTDTILDDYYCTESYYYICEFKCPPTPSTTTATTTTTTTILS